MYSSDRTELPGSSMFVSNNICNVTVRLVVPRTRRLLDLADDVDGPTVASESVTAVPFISHPFTIWRNTYENKWYRKARVGVVKFGRVNECNDSDETKTETKNWKTASAYERNRSLFGTTITKTLIRTHRKRRPQRATGNRRRYVNYPRKNSNLNDWNNLMIILIIDAHITIISDRLINITPPPV